MIARVRCSEGAEAGPVPIALVAVTVNVSSSVVRPVTTWLNTVVPAFESTPPAGLEV
jgi:hypothetical protein